MFINMLRQIIKEIFSEHFNGISLNSFFNNSYNTGIEYSTKIVDKDADLIEIITRGFAKGFFVEKNHSRYKLYYLWPHNTGGDNIKKMSSKTKDVLKLIKTLDLFKFDFIYIPEDKADRFTYVSRVSDIEPELNRFITYHNDRFDLSDCTYFRINKNSSNIYLFYIDNKYKDRLFKFMDRFHIKYKVFA